MALTRMLLPIQLARFDERTREVYILAGEDFQVLVNSLGEKNYDV